MLKQLLPLLHLILPVVTFFLLEDDLGIIKAWALIQFITALVLIALCHSTLSFPKPYWNYWSVFASSWVIGWVLLSVWLVTGGSFAPLVISLSLFVLLFVLPLRFQSNVAQK